MTERLTAESVTTSATPERRKKRRLTVRRLSAEELISRNPFGELVPFHSEYRNRFLKDNVFGLDVGGVTCLFVDINHQNIDPRTKDLISSPKTKFVVAEYYGPDLERHGLYDGKNILIRMTRRTKGYKKRLQFAKDLTDACSASDKPVLVSDIANGPLYEMMYMLYRGFPQGLGGIGFPTELAQSHPLLAGIALYMLGNSTMNVFQEALGAGIFNPDKVSRFERFFTDLEQARRLFVAKGLEQQIQKMVASTPGEDKGTIVVLYPRAHGIRIAEMLENPKRIKDTLRDLMYRAMAPFLEYSVREYQDRQLVDKRRIKMFSRRLRIRPTTETN